MHMARTDSQRFANRTHLWIQNCSGGQKFSPSGQVGTLCCRIMAQDTSQLTSDAHGSDSQSKICKSNPPVISHEESKQKISASQHVRMLEELIRVANTLHATADRPGADRVSQLFQWGTPKSKNCSAGQNFSHHGTFECLGVISSLVI